MIVSEKDRFKSLLTQKNYNVKSVKDYSVILESDDGLSQVLTNEENLELFYKRLLDRDGLRPNG